LQFSVSNIRWETLHRVEFMEDERSINFTTIIYVYNQSNFPFHNAKIQFYEKSLPFDKVLPEQEENEGETQKDERAVQTYLYDKRTTLSPNQSKMFLWSSAKRISIATNNGLFVGGGCLNKMNAPAYPKIESRISFPNIKEIGLGRPLPAGKVAVYQCRNGFVSLLGYSKTRSARVGQDINIRMHSLLTPNIQDEDKDSEYGLLSAKLTQSSYRMLTPTLSEAEYQLVVTNSQNTSVSVTVTLNKHPSKTYSIIRSSLPSEITKHGESTWKLEIPPNTSREVLYKLTIRVLS
jgi:hypothetical protein